MCDCPCTRVYGPTTEELSPSALAPLSPEEFSQLWAALELVDDSDFIKTVETVLAEGREVERV